MKYFGYFIILVVAAAIISGFFVVGSPVQSRKQALDEQRISDLNSLQGQIANYWQVKRVLPPNLDVLNDDLRGFRVPTDPETKKSYEYNLKADKTFELCATFAYPTNPNIAQDKYSQPYFGSNPVTWEHGAGRACFERTIDPDYFPVTKPLIP